MASFAHFLVCFGLEDPGCWFHWLKGFNKVVATSTQMLFGFGGNKRSKQRSVQATGRLTSHSSGQRYAPPLSSSVMHPIKAMMKSSSKNRCFWFLVGLGVSLVVIWILLDWIGKVRWITGQPNLIYDRQPHWLKITEEVFGWIPIVSIFAVIWLRILWAPRVKVLSYCAGIAIPYVLMAGIWLFGPSVSDYVHRENFESELWKSQDSISQGSNWPPRLTMVDDLISNGRLNGLTEREVFELLGPPHEKGFPYGLSPEDIHYYLGPERGLVRIDSEWLVIRFDATKKVEKYWILRD